MCVCLKCFMDTKLIPVNCVTHVNRVMCGFYVINLLNVN